MSSVPSQSLLALAIGFAFAGLLASGYQLIANRPASFRLLHNGPGPGSIAAVPLLVFAAPFIIMRSVLRSRSLEQRQFEFVMMATIVCGLWSLMSGTVVMTMLSALTRVLS
jgi:hypothetical protein